MRLSQLAVAITMSTILIGASGISTTAMAVDKNGIIIDSGKGWRIEQNAGRTGGWIWEGGGKSGKSATRKDAEKAAKKAARAARRAARNNVIANPDCRSPDTPPCT